MLSHIVKRVVKLQIKLLIINSVIFCSISSSAQKITDTTGFKKDFEQLLKRYGINSKGYLINVTSINQKGGQTALVITNNYFRDTVLNETNFEFQIDTQGNQKTLIVFPKTGIWTSPFVLADSIKANRRFFDPGIGVVTSISGIEVLFEGKTYSMIGAAQSTPCSKRFPIYIYLNPDDPDEIFLLGDFQDSNKSYLFHKGKVIWIPGSSEAPMK
jgi:hypothetical protein